MLLLGSPSTMSKAKNAPRAGSNFDHTTLEAAEEKDDQLVADGLLEEVVSKPQRRFL